MRTRHPLTLLAVLLVSSAMMAAIGMAIRCTVGREVRQLQSGPAVAVPLMVLADPTLLRVPKVTPPVNDTETLAKPKETPSGSRIPSIAPTPEVHTDADQLEVQTEEPPAVTFGPVEDSYFDDVLFIGDSRTVGLSQYGRLGQADYFADVGLTVFNLWDKALSDTNLEQQTLETLLSNRSYGKIYVMLGINELGYPMDSLLRQYQSTVSTIQKLQPQADLLLCANLHVTRTASAGTSWLTMENLCRLEAEIKAMTDGEHSFYLDANPVFCDAEGYLKDDMTGDGVHPYAAGYTLWADWLREHGIIRNEETTVGGDQVVHSPGAGL
ncbi:GDSL-type esterase/lipase family protein [Candidatus Avoscillospira sp. LCP25S3_F1]|uniref:GDSL-type esterase/lipase family protein n=1 Tax=Candidatus Avoscillospira sp. LCP25S3_F1 TaxID=3438825 RepID=UPI003F918E28